MLRGYEWSGQRGSSSSSSNNNNSFWSSSSSSMLSSVSKTNSTSSKENKTPIDITTASINCNIASNPSNYANHITNCITDPSPTNASAAKCYLNASTKPCFPHPHTNTASSTHSPKSSCKENEEPNTIPCPNSNTNAVSSNDLKPYTQSTNPRISVNPNANPNPSRGFFGMKKSAHTCDVSKDWSHTCLFARDVNPHAHTSEPLSAPSSRPLLSRSNSSLSSLGRRKKRNPGEPCADAGDSRFLESPTTPSHSSHVWDDPEAYGENYIAPASAWSTLGTRALLCRPLPLDVGRCVCYITREPHDGVNGFALYTDEGYGRQDRKLAVAFHKRRGGKTEFIVFSLGLESNFKSGGAILGRVQANLLGTRFLIWDEAEPTTSQRSSVPPLLGVVMFQPTATTLTGSFRVMRVSIPKYHSTQIVSSTYRENGLAQDWEENTKNSYQLYSRKPVYNKATKSYELDFKDRTRRSTKILTSARNFQLTMNENGKQTILMLGKIGKSKYLMEYRFPMTAYQAFSIALASMDAKLCCSL